MDRETRSIIDDLSKDKVHKTKWKPEDLLSTGSTLLNCAISDYELGGILPGEFIMEVGASEGGKTAFYHSCFAEACLNPKFDDYDLYVDDSEGGALFNIRKFWGKRLAKRIKAPKTNKKGKPEYSRTIEDMFDMLDDICSKGRPFLLAEDSMDALMTRDEQKHYLKQKRARRLGQQESGSYGTDRARKLSVGFRQLRPRIRELGAVVFLVFQEKQNIGFGKNAESKTHAGGLAPKYYANLQLWFSVRQQIVKKVGNIRTELGMVSRVKIKKNRLTGKHRTIDLPFYHSFGFDDIGSCVDFLIDSGRWKKTGKIIKANGLGLQGNKSGLIRNIEDMELEPDLRTIVGEAWRELETKATPVRKRRYG